MDEAVSIEMMSGSELLDHVDDLATTQRRCEVELLRAAVQHAVIHNPETLDPELTRLPGRERSVRYGGVNTPHVAQFACADLGARLGKSAWSAHALIADALDLVIRLPQLWARVEKLQVQASYARFVARRTRDLTPAQAAYVDSRVVEAADGRIPWTRFEELVKAAVAAADPVATATREAEEARKQVARPTVTGSHHGMRGFFIRAPFPVIIRLDAVLGHVAGLLAAQGDTDPVEVLRVKAILLLTHPAAATELLTTHHSANPDTTADGDEPARPPAEANPEVAAEMDWSTLLPSVRVFLHLYAGTHTQPSEGVARVEGYGPVTETWIRRHLHPDTRVKVTPVVDLEGQAPVDAYEIPDRHRQAVHLMTPADTFPFAPNTRRGKQIDHTVPYNPQAPPGAGQSRIGNYGPMTTFHHRVKTHGRWHVEQPFPGIYLWRDPHGALYLVDHTGTRRLGVAA
jgi:hypothetical protein